MAEIPTYTYRQLKKLNLPGYKEQANVYDLLDRETDWTPVLSASIFLVDPFTLAKKTLTGVRKSNTHDNVVSTPTMQIPKTRRWLESFIRSRASFLIDQEPETLSKLAPFTRQFATIASYNPNPEFMDNGSILPYYVDRLNTYKLGLPSVSGAVGRATIGIGSASLSSVHLGFSRVGVNEKKEPLFEANAKVAAAVYLTHEAAALLPEENEKYAHIGWTEDSRTFPEDVRNKDTRRLVPIAGNIAVWYCAYGLCLDATSAVTSRDDIDEHFMLNRTREEYMRRLQTAHKSEEHELLRRSDR